MQSRLIAVSVILQALFTAMSQPFIGVNYGEVADNLPPPDATARLLSTTTITHLRLYTADPAIIKALAGTNISLAITASNADIPSLASSPSAAAAWAAAWAAANVLPFLPSTPITLLSVGNEILNSSNPDHTLPSNLLPAMQNLRSALPATVQISTVHSMSVLSQSDPPSSAAFDPNLAGDLNPILAFLLQSGSPFMVNPYPYFAYQSDPRAETLDFCLFRSSAGRVDAGSGLTYHNMFDAQVDAVRAALRAAGYGGVEVVVAETGWPYRGDAGEAGATVENAAAYNGGLVAHLRAMAGTPMVPGRSVETYIFALYDEDLKPGPESERSFGMFRPDLTMIYDAGLVRPGSDGVSPAAAPVESPPALPPPPPPPAAGLVGTGGPVVGYCSQKLPGGACNLPASVDSGAEVVGTLMDWIAVAGRRQRSGGCWGGGAVYWGFGFSIYLALPMLLLT